MRDIWNRRTWCSVTSIKPEAEAEADQHEECFDPVETAGSSVLHRASHMKKVGRPLGSKDSKPRRRRLNGVSAPAEIHRQVPIMPSDMRHDLQETDQLECGTFELLSFPPFEIDVSNINTAQALNFDIHYENHNAAHECESCLDRIYPFYLRL